MHALRALVLLAPLVWGCAGPSQTTRYRSLEEAWLRAAPADAGRADDPFAGHATLERHPQETSLDDPMLEYDLAPASIGSSMVDTGQRVALSQALPFPGKL